MAQLYIIACEGLKDQSGVGLIVAEGQIHLVIDFHFALKQMSVTSDSNTRIRLLMYPIGIRQNAFTLIEAHNAFVLYFDHSDMCIAMHNKTNDG